MPTREGQDAFMNRMADEFFCRERQLRDALTALAAKDAELAQARSDREGILKQAANAREEANIYYRAHNEQFYRAERAEAERDALRAETAWISVEDRLPEPTYSHNYMAWIKCDNKAGGYRELVAYGEWFCDRDDVEPGDEGYVENSDEGNYRGYGWHRTEEAHGGDYDYITTGLNESVTHWRPVPQPPAQPETATQPVVEVAG